MFSPRMRYLCALLFSTIIVTALETRGQDDGFVPLFNGKDLSGWVLTNTPPETWSFQDGMLICTGKPIGEIRTEKMYQNFVIELEWRHMVPRGNAGIFLWADDITSRGVPFHRGIEVQVLENAYGNSQSHTTHGDIFPIHGATMTPINGRGGARAFPTEERSRPSPEWNHYRIEANDGSVALSVNGKLVTQGKDAEPRKGYICIESEGGVVHYRNARIKVLPDTPIEQRQIAIANRGFRSVYTGLNLKGWQTSSQGETHWQPKDWVLQFDGAIPVEQSTLTSDDLGAIHGLVIDFRFTKDSRSLSINLPGSSAPVSIQADNATEQLEKRGSWNRLIASQTDDGQFQIQINGKDHSKVAASGKGAVKISSDGAIELANIYVR